MGYDVQVEVFALASGMAIQSYLTEDKIGYIGIGADK